MSARAQPVEVHGHCDPRFAAVREEFERNFAERGEVGAAVAVHHEGELVVDLWGGMADPRRERPWERDTLVIAYSTTKGVASSTVALLHARGLLDYDARVAEYWPEFAQNGKEDVTVRQLLAHQAGLAAVATRLDPRVLADPVALADALARQKPAWEPGTRHGYHLLSLGWYQSALVRRVDPQGRGLAQFFAEEIAGPLDLDFHIGQPEHVPDERIARVSSAPLVGMFRPGRMPRRMLVEIAQPWTIPGKTFTNPRLRGLGHLASRTWRGFEVPSANGIGDARSLARLFGDLAAGGAAVGWTPETFAEVTAPYVPPRGGQMDLVLRAKTSWHLGFVRPHERIEFGGDERAFGHPGAGGSFAFADPANRLGFAYLPNRLGHYLANDPREYALRQAVEASLASTPAAVASA